VDLGLAAGAFFLLAIVAFRRVRRVRTPEARRSGARRSVRTGTRRAATTVLTFARAAVGVVALIGVVWLAVELFR
jgi:hypothetical protein